MEIDRAIEILNPDHREHYDSIEEVNEACRMGMEALERQRWIPCSEELPPVNQTIVVLSSSDRYYYVGKINSVCKNGQIILAERDGYPYHHARYWIPLPEPPKEGGSGNAFD